MSTSSSDFFCLALGRDIPGCCLPACTPLGGMLVMFLHGLSADRQTRLGERLFTWVLCWGPILMSSSCRQGGGPLLASNLSRHFLLFSEFASSPQKCCAGLSHRLRTVRISRDCGFSIVAAGMNMVIADAWTPWREMEQVNGVPSRRKAE